ncbi:META domain-containing protein [Lacinutrix neustonica]|uniref:META domain-containing protein n=1 Tax=Lacinutrix neustonica TaxID=2980107 RepID=A0A9E8MUM4_9FLAO|nr:META domain-containing protein [Lacinutrix neustonica]WAC01224.1 META domain-containing protein [Lacinutrix neustonica]
MKTITILLFTVILNACGASESKTSDSVDQNNNSSQETLNGSFMVSDMNNTSSLENLTLNFEETSNKVSGFSGCNRFFGDYTLENNTISFKDLASTKKMCLENENTLELKMMKALTETTNFRIKDNKIVLYNGEKELLTATKTSAAEMMQNDIKIEYKAHTRGSFKKIIIDNKKVTVQNVIDGKAEVKTCSDEDWKALMTLIEKTDLKAMTTLEAPSKAFQYDGAAMVNFSILIDGDTYNAPGFDAGNPNKAIEPLVTMVLNIAAETKG